jgi:HD superfamily phosphohydrolase
MIQQNAVIINYDRIKLSHESNSIIENSPTFDNLKLPINSTIGYSQALSQFRITRHEHSIHSAKQAHLLKNAELTPYELKCLEVALLLHDLGHTLGSHSIDKLYYSMADSPHLTEFGYSEHDYHEYHTVQLLQSQEFLDIFRHNLTLLSDVIAILSHDDTRPFNIKCPNIRGSSLSQKQIKMLYDLKDWLDRISYLELEYLASGSTDKIINSALVQLQQFRATIEIHDKQMVFRSGSCAQNIILLRERLFEETVYHPLAQAYDEYIKRNITESCHTYDQLKTAALTSPEDLFSPELYQVLIRNSTRCLTEELTPLLTLDSYFLTDIGINAFAEYSNNKYQCFTRSVLKRPFSASFGELIINLCANERLDRDIYTIHTKKPHREFNYLMIQDNKIVPERKTVNVTPNQPVIIAIRNPTSEAEVQTLKSKIEREFVKRQWVRPDLNFDALYDRNIFKQRAGTILARHYTL